VLHGAVDSRVVLRDDHDDDGEYEPDKGREIDVYRGKPRHLAHHLHGDEVECDGSENRRAEHPLVQSTHDVLVLAKLDEEHGDHRCHDRDRAKGQREYRGDLDAGVQQVSEQHGCNRRHGVRLEEVGRHACAVTNIVADVVGDRRRISRIVLGDACLELADEVCTDISTLCEDATSEPRKDGYEASSETESDLPQGHPLPLQQS